MAGVSPETAPETRKIYFFGCFWPVSGPGWAASGQFLSVRGPPIGGTKTLERDEADLDPSGLVLSIPGTGAKPFESIGPPLTRTGPQPLWLKMALGSPRTPIARVPGALWAPNGAHRVRPRRAIKLGSASIAPETASGTGKIPFSCFRPVLGLFWTQTA